MHRIIAKSVVLAALIAMEAACGGGSPEEARAEHLRRGDALMAEGRMDEAIIEYKGAVQADAMSWEARQKLAEAHIKADDIAGALAQYVRAADLAPEQVDIQIKAGKLLLAVGAFQDARARAEAAMARDPNNVTALILAANARGGLRDLDGAIAELEGAIKVDPSQGATYANLGVLAAANGDVEQAEAALKRAVAASPASAEIKLALANLYWATRREDAAIPLIESVLELEPNHLLANRALAMLHLTAGRTAAAEAPMKVIAENAPDGEGQLALAHYYAASGQPAKAQPILQGLATSGGPAAAQARLRLAAMGLASGDRAAAMAEVQAVLKQDPKNVEALVGRAHLELLDGRSADAVVTAREATGLRPRSPQAQYVLGRALASQYQIADAIAAHRAALAANSRFAPAATELARLSLAAGRPEEAVEHARTALAIVPRDGETRLLLARALVTTSRTSEAEKELRQLAARFPKNHLVHAELGRLLAARGDMAGARAAFDRAIAASPVDITSLTGLVSLDLRQKNPAAARKRVEAALAASPKNAGVHMVAARTFASTGDLARAETALRTALQLDSANPQIYGLLAEVFLRQNRLDDAIAEFKKAADRQPKEVANHVIVGYLLHTQNKLDEASASYERALAIDPRAGIAANNLASIYADKNESLDVALQLAQTAKSVLPEVHEVDDTLRLLYYKKNQAPQAITSLRAAVAAQPDNPVYLYHLGAAYALADDKTNARQTLQKALKLSTNFPGADDARKILQSLEK